MCDRFTLRSAWSDIQAMYRLGHVVITDLDVSDRSDRAPTENVIFVTAGDEDHHTLRRGRWGLVPWKAKAVPSQNLFNARVEIVDTSSTFKDAWACKRCLVPADGFYVVGRDGETWFVHKSGGQPFSFAGLWAHNGRLGITSCALITVPATEPLTPLLNKAQPVILAPESHDAWLDAATPSEDLMRLLECPDGAIEFHRVNSVQDAGVERTSTVSDGKTSPALREARKDRSASGPSEGPNEIFIDRNDPLLARRASIVSFNCQHAGCKNVAFWGYSPNGQGPRNWFCNEHRADGEALLGRQQPKQAAAASYVR